MTAQPSSWKQYICRACGLIYDEEQGDPDSGLAPGTRFEDIPDDWECPLCGVTKRDFELYVQREPVMVNAMISGVRETGVIVVGAGLSGWAAVESLRALDAALPITLITSCQGHLYHKPELSVALSRGMTADALVRERAVDAAQRLGVRLYAETFVVGLMPSLHQLRTTRGTFSYTKLILAQGARAALPPALPRALCWRVNDLAGWEGLRAQLAAGAQRVAIIGAGMVGCELAEDFARAGHQVTLLDRRRWPLAALLPEKAAGWLLDSQRALGIAYLGDREVASVSQSGSGEKQITTRCGNTITVDHIVAATGLVTDSRLARVAGLAFEHGFVVDECTLRTSDADIHALGDCISLGGQACRFIEAITKQAQAIAHAVLGLSDAAYQHTQPVIRLKTRSLPIEIHGLPLADGAWQVIREDADGLLMTQQRNGHVASTLRIGQAKAA